MPFCVESYILSCLISYDTINSLLTFFNAPKSKTCTQSVVLMNFKILFTFYTRCVTPEHTPAFKSHHHIYIRGSVKGIRLWSIINSIDTLQQIKLFFSARLSTMLSLINFSFIKSIFFCFLDLVVSFISTLRSSSFLFFCLLLGFCSLLGKKKKNYMS
jgi:hypothetical protein